MSQRRILSLWFPRLGAERWLRADPHLREHPFATVASNGNAQSIAALSETASEAGVHRGQPLRDAHAICATLVTRPALPHEEAAFLDTLHRWAGKFSPWIAPEPPDALVADLTGCAHLFGGEVALCARITEDCAALGLTARTGLADTLGAAWALARYTSDDRAHPRSGDAIEQEAPATRAKAGKRRHWERGGTTPSLPAPRHNATRIATRGNLWQALSPLPVAALRLDPATHEELLRLGLRRIGDLIGQPRAGLARRFGRGLVDRLDQAMGGAPEPVSPKPPPERFAVRMSFPEPIGREEDVAEAFSRMTDRLCEKLRPRGQGIRRLRLEAHRCDHEMQWQIITTARATDQPYRLTPLIDMKIADMDAGPGIDMLRLETLHTEALNTGNGRGHTEAAELGSRRRDKGAGLEDLLGRLGARLGMEALTRRHPAHSHLPENSAQVLAAAWSAPANGWRPPPRARPLVLWPPEPLMAPDRHDPPEQFRWRGQDWRATPRGHAERIAPEWWFDHPDWRSGVRDYWCLDTDRGDQLWVYYAHGAALSSGWFCHGRFA